MHFITDRSATEVATPPAARVRPVRGQISEKALKGVAIAAAVVALGAVIYFTTAGAPTGGQHGDMHFKCAECGYEWALSFPEATKALGGNSAKKLTCPKCDKQAGGLMIRCRCGKRYLPKPKGTPEAFKCPHCGYDPHQPKPRKPDRTGGN